MIATGGTKRILSGCWIIAALVLLGYNGSELITLIGSPLIGHSKDIKLAGERWRQLKKIESKALQKENDYLDLDLVLSKVVPVFKKQEKKILAAVKGKKDTERIILPVLTGIITFSTINGNKKSFALLDGKRLEKLDRIQGFTVKKINAKGVELTKGGAIWFIEAPKVYYSVDKGS